MGAVNVLRKMFGGVSESATKAFDEYGQPIRKQTIDEHLLEKHLEIEHKRKVRKALDFYQKKHYREMTSMRMPYHKVNKRIGHKQLY